MGSLLSVFGEFLGRVLGLAKERTASSKVDDFDIIDDCLGYNCEMCPQSGNCVIEDYLLNDTSCDEEESDKVLCTACDDCQCWVNPTDGLCDKAKIFLVSYNQVEKTFVCEDDELPF